MAGAAAHSPDDLAQIAARLAGAHRLVEAEEVATMGLKADPRHSRLVFEHAFALLRQGRAEEAVDALRRAAQRQPQDANVRMLLAFALNYDARATPSEVAAAHLQYGMALRRVVGPAARAEDLVRQREEKFPRASHPRVRLGFVSADVYRHSVTYFLEPLLEHLPRERFEVFVLDSSRKHDEVTARLRGLVEHWSEMESMDHAVFAMAARELALDVAVDLSGLTSGHRQAAFARRIAPVQVSYMGYPHASGVDTFDARLADEITDPPGAPNVMGENVLRLPGCFVAYRPAGDVPTIRDSTREVGVAPITFGCFGNLAKINRATLGVWARVMHTVPGSRLVLKNHALADRFLREEARTGSKTLLARLGDAGLDVARVELRQPSASEAEHLGAYNDIDVALDTWPYNGTTTTCEALIMGVPVVTFAGDRHAARVGASVLGTCGCLAWCASDVDGCVARARAVAGAGPRSKAQRNELRRQVLASTLCDSQRLGKEFAAAIEALLQSRRAPSLGG
jgi:protein O-GlcNAc transferase